MKVVATADFHGALPTIPKCDLLLIAGDICPDYIRSYKRIVSGVPTIQITVGEFRQANWLQDEFTPWLDQVKAEHVVGIAGNHDFVFERPGLGSPGRMIYLQDSMREVSGLNIYGVPWVPELPGWAFGASQEKLAAAYEAVPDSADIVLSHGPPYKTLDLAPRGGHVGCEAILPMLDRVEPRLFVCGHIHEGYGVEQRGRTTIINAAYMDGDYDPINRPVVIDL